VPLDHVGWTTAATLKDFSAPQAQVSTTFTGNGGPSVGNTWNKLLYAIKFGSTDLFFSSQTNEASQILYDRDPANRVVEVGWVCYGDALKRSRLATEAQYLLMHYVFDKLLYRRYEWKCDALNQPSKRAAERLGFTYEGRFRQAVVYKGRNRDTDWLSMIDSDWPVVKTRLEKWLSPDNFDEKGQQIKALSEF